MKLKVRWLVNGSGSPYPIIFAHEVKQYANENNICVTQEHDPPLDEPWSAPSGTKGVVTFEGDDMNKLLWLSGEANRFCRRMELLTGSVPPVEREFLGEGFEQINLLLGQIDRLKNGAGAAVRELKDMGFWSCLRRKKIVEVSEKLEELLNASI